MGDSSKISKGILIKKAVSRAKRAHRAGFYLETISLCDSIIGNRMNSIVRDSSGEKFKSPGIGFGSREINRLGIPIFTTDLLVQTNEWSRKRNSSLHGISRLEDFESSSWRSRLNACKQVSEEGIQLALLWLREAPKHSL
ncbi:MAG: hypothetical protein RL228_1146 [Actinomycetota bacterium]|jgi:hypothetical protein